MVWPFTKRIKAPKRVVRKSEDKKEETLADSTIFSRMRQKTNRLEKLLADVVVLRRQELPNNSPRKVGSYYNALDSKIESNWKAISTSLEEIFGLWQRLSPQAKKMPMVVKLHTHLMDCQKALALEVNDDLFPISRMLYEYDLANNTVPQTRLSRNQSLAKRLERALHKLVKDGKEL